MEDQDVLTVEEAAKLLKVTPGTVRMQARQGLLPARKVGRAWRFSRRGLLAWLEGKQHGKETP